MRPSPWIFTMTALISVAWSEEKANRREVFNIGTDVMLMCSYRTWKEILYVIWNITVRDHSCRISISSDGEQSVNTCKNGKSLQNTSTFQPYLHIPNFSAEDVGLYMCESPYNGGSENYNINVSITVAPTISAWLEYNGSEMVAVCRAEQGNPAANIRWSPAENTSVETTHESNGFFTVESRIAAEELPENLTCVIRHQLWSQDKTLVPDRNETKAAAKGFYSHLALMCTGVVGVVLVILAGFVYFALKKATLLPLCQQTDTSTSKPPVTEDVEEVEPYASYVQRVNSIYN